MHNQPQKDTFSSVNEAASTKIRLYDWLFFKEVPEEGKAVDFMVNFNPDSLTVLTDCGRMDACVAAAHVGALDSNLSGCQQQETRDVLNPRHMLRLFPLTTYRLTGYET